MGLEEREDFFLVRDHLTSEHSPLDLIDLALGMAHELLELG